MIGFHAFLKSKAVEKYFDDHSYLIGTSIDKLYIDYSDFINRLNNEEMARYFDEWMAKNAELDKLAEKKKYDTMDDN